VFDKYDRLMGGIEAVRGVQSATLSIMPVLANGEWEESLRPDGAADPQDVFIQVVRWNFLQTMGMALVAGRGLSDADTEGWPRVAIINETMARQSFGEPYPVGRHLQFVNGQDRNVSIQVIGVARDANTRVCRNAHALRHD
jgi:MacB-like periplasmic core domain